MKKHATTNQSETDWERIRNMKDEDIDYSDIPPLTDEFFKNAVLRRNFKPIPRKKQITLRVDSDVLDHLRAKGNGYQTMINQLLRAFVEADKAAHAK